MSILVTGGLGVNGVWVIRQLVQDGYRPLVYDNRNEMSLLKDIADKFDFVMEDICDQEIAFSGADHQ